MLVTPGLQAGDLDLRPEQPVESYATRFEIKTRLFCISRTSADWVVDFALGGVMAGLGPQMLLVMIFGAPLAVPAEPPAQEYAGKVHAPPQLKFEAGECGMLAMHCKVLEWLFPLQTLPPSESQAVGWRLVGRAVPAGRGQVFYWIVDRSQDGQATGYVFLSQPDFWEEAEQVTDLTEETRNTFLARTRAISGRLSSSECTRLNSMSRDFERMRVKVVPTPEIVMDADIYNLRITSLGGTVDMVTTAPDKALRRWVLELRRLTEALVAVSDH